MDIKFTVLTSIYQKEQPEYFEMCMQSLWSNQTLKPNEIILVRDGPLTTELNELIEKWSSKLKGSTLIIKHKIIYSIEIKISNIFNIILSLFLVVIEFDFIIMKIIIGINTNPIINGIFISPFLFIYFKSIYLI